MSKKTSKKNPSLPVDFPLDPRKRAVVVGASSGIGAALARKLAAEGYIVAVLARREEMLEELCAEINAAAGETRAVAYRHDVTDFDQVPIVFQTVLKDLKRIDTLLYVAGNQVPMEDTEYAFEKDHTMIQINLLGAMAWLTQAGVLFDRMGEGQIVGISSVAGDRGRVKNPGYNASKAAFSTYLEGMRNRLTRRGVNVLTIIPGFVDTDELKDVGMSFLVIPPEKAAADIYNAMKHRKQTVYTPWVWRYIMLIIRNIPSIIFRRLSI